MCTFLPCFVRSMYLLVKVTCWNNGILNKYNLYNLYYIHVQTSCFAASTFLRDNAWKNKIFFLPTDPTQKCRVGKGANKVFFNLGLMHVNI